MKLVIAEKPDMAKAYAEAMKDTGRFTKGEGYYKNDKFIITWAYGHLVNSREPEDYPKEIFGGWNWESIPFVPPSGKLEYHSPNKNSFDEVRKKQLNSIKKVCQQQKFEEIINGCDAGREGDLIFWEIYEILKLKTPVKRLWVQSKVSSDIQTAFANLRGEDFFEPRKESAYGRQFADYILGNNLTVAFTIKSGRRLHVGRVQTPTLSLLVKRRLEIENFKSKDYYEIKANFGDKYDGFWFKDVKSNTKFDSKEEAEEIVNKIKNQTATVTIKEVEEQKINAKELFDLGSLQTEANKKFGFTMQKTLDVAQLLYDKYKVLSYPRTDSKYIMSSQVAELPDLLKAVEGPKFHDFIEDIFARKIPTNKRFVNDKKVTDHHAIIPTKKPINYGEITDEIKNGEVVATKEDIKSLYDLVVRRFLSVFYPPAVYEKTEIVTEVLGNTFKTNGRILKEAGWEIVYGKDVVETDEENPDVENGEKTLPPIEKGEQNQVTNSLLLPKQTKAKPHYTEGAIAKAMENAKDYLEEDELKDEMKDSGAGLGTVATRAQIVENLISRKYVIRKGKQIIASDLGVNLIEIAPERLKSPEVTANWEKDLRLIEQGEVHRDDFYNRIVEFVTEEILELKNKKIDITFESEDSANTVGLCPKCNQPIIEFPKGFACKSNNKEVNCFIVWKSILNKKITKIHINQLLTKRETNLIKGFKTKTGKQFDAKLKLKPDLNGVEFVFETKETKELDLSCPKCKGKVYDRETFVYCENNTKESPCFSIFKEIAGKKLSQKNIKDLINNGKTELIEGFKSKQKDKGTFSAYLKYETGKVEFEFPERKPVSKKDTGVKCPCCDGNIIEMDKNYGCDGFSSNQCKFVVWKNIGGKEITLELLQEILKVKETEKLDGFISKAGKPYKAKLVWNEKKKTIEMSFN